jgi:hypothetical protein
MWVRKTPEELLHEESTRFVNSLCFASSFFSLVWTFMIPHASVHIPAGLRFAGTLAGALLLLAWYRRFRWHRSRSRALVCERCGVVRTDGGRDICDCGTRMAPRNEVTWIETPRFSGSVAPEVDYVVSTSA